MERQRTAAIKMYFEGVVGDRLGMKNPKHGKVFREYESECSVLSTTYIWAASGGKSRWVDTKEPPPIGVGDTVVYALGWHPRRGTVRPATVLRVGDFGQLDLAVLTCHGDGAPYAPYAPRGPVEQAAAPPEFLAALVVVKDVMHDRLPGDHEAGRWRARALPGERR